MNVYASPKWSSSSSSLQSNINMIVFSRWHVSLSPPLGVSCESHQRAEMAAFPAQASWRLQMKTKHDTVDGSEIPNNHLGCFQNPMNTRISTTIQLVIAGFLNHQYVAKYKVSPQQTVKNFLQVEKAFGCLGYPTILLLTIMPKWYGVSNESLQKESYNNQLRKELMNIQLVGYLPFCCCLLPKDQPPWFSICSTDIIDGASHSSQQNNGIEVDWSPFFVYQPTFTKLRGFKPTWVHLPAALNLAWLIGDAHPIIWSAQPNLHDGQIGLNFWQRNNGEEKFPNSSFTKQMVLSACSSFFRVAKCFTVSICGCSHDPVRNQWSPYCSKASVQLAHKKQVLKNLTTSESSNTPKGATSLSSCIQTIWHDWKKGKQIIHKTKPTYFGGWQGIHFMKQLSSFNRVKFMSYHGNQPGTSTESKSLKAVKVKLAEKIMPICLKP